MLGSRHELALVLGRVAKRDRAAFATLYQATAPKLFGIVYRILCRRDVAEEVLQEVYVKIWERAADFNAEIASPITWMATIARNRALDEVRRGRAIPLDDVAELEQMAGEHEHPLADRERSEELARLQACLDGLDPDKREIVRLAHLHGMSRDALAERFKCPSSTIKTWLRRSLAQLKDCLGT